MLKNLFSLALVLAAFQSFAQGPLISAKDFAANTADVYAKQHIQGAISIPLKELYKTGAVEGQVKPAEELAAYLAKKGISNASKIVVYDEGSNRYNTRIWWILKSAGMADVSILHFNMDQFLFCISIWTSLQQLKFR